MNLINDIVQGISKLMTSSLQVTRDVLLLQFKVVNACLVGEVMANSNEWVLVDTGLENSAAFIKQTVEKRFGANTRPAAIILTHGHFDHVGSVIELASFWDVPVYVHELELPYITGQEDYPQGDTSVDEGLIAKMSSAFPHKSINLGLRAVQLPSDGSVPGMPDWQWIHTPGHTKGHICLFRNKDGLLIVGDAFTTTKQESLKSVLTQEEEVKGPPAYLTTDWQAAENTIKMLRDLNPRVVIPSHGLPMQGEELDQHLERLAKYFEEIAMPEQGRFVDNQL